VEAVTITTHNSASQVGTKRDCWRWWAYDKSRPKPPPKQSALDGTAIHLVLENWLRFQLAPDPTTKAGRTALTGLHLIPQPRTCLVEQQITPTGVLPGFRGKIDFIDVEKYDTFVIGDHKTVGKWSIMDDKVKTLATDPQRIIYSEWAVRTFQVAALWFLWVFYLRGSDQHARAAWYHATAAEIAVDFARLERDDVEPMRRALPMLPDRIDEFPRTLTACGKYGGCPYRSECLATVPPRELAAAMLAAA